MKTNLKNQIIRLRKQGKSYREIQKVLGCSSSSVNYYCSKGAKTKRLSYNYELRKRLRNKIKQKAGGKCSICGYNKCLAALDFHHPDPTQKECNISIIVTTSYSKAKKEALKCILLCANCHRELHSK